MVIDGFHDKDEVHRQSPLADVKVVKRINEDRVKFLL